MPLMGGKSKGAFSHNVRTEMEHGKPQNQALAIAYAMKKKAKKYAEGGPVGTPKAGQTGYETGVHQSGSGGIHSSTAGDLARVGTSLKSKGERARVYGEKHAGEGALNKSKEIHRSKLEEMKAMPKPNLFAHGGMVDCYQDDDGLDMIDRIMAKRGYSEGGMIANDVEPSMEEASAQYDDLVNRDDLESSYTGANSGDMDGGMSEDDMIDRIMMKRHKDRMPRPA